MFRIEFGTAALLVLGLAGCDVQLSSPGGKGRTGALGVTTEDVNEMGRPVAQPKQENGVIGKTTDDIGKFDPNARQEVSNQKIQATDPITAPLAAYSPMMEKVSMIQIDSAVNLFYGTEGRYPKDYDEFMEKIVKANNIKLPVLPYGGKYKYDEVNHVLMVVRPAPQPQGGKP